MTHLTLYQCKITGPDTFELLFGNDAYVIGLGIDPTRQPRTFNLTISKYGNLIVGLTDATLMECIRELSTVTLDLEESVSILHAIDIETAIEIAKMNYEEGL
jgi:hypothetical protein